MLTNQSEFAYLIHVSYYGRYWWYDESNIYDKRYKNVRIDDALILQ